MTGDETIIAQHIKEYRALLVQQVAEAKGDWPETFRFPEPATDTAREALRLFVNEVEAATGIKVTDRYAYKAEGLRDNGDVYAVQDLGYQSEPAALLLAQRCADTWQATVNLLRVPLVDARSVQFVQQFLPTRSNNAL